MKKQKFKSILLLAIFSLAFILGGCSSNTSQGDSSNETVVEAPASSYCKNGTHMYGPGLSITIRKMAVLQPCWIIQQVQKRTLTALLFMTETCIAVCNSLMENMLVQMTSCLKSIWKQKNIPSMILVPMSYGRQIATSILLLLTAKTKGEFISWI